MSHSFIDYPSSGPDQGIIKDLTPAADTGMPADAICGSLKRLYSRTMLGLNDRGFDVRQYGAVGDGIVDDTVAIQTALTAGAGSNVILSPSQTYLISAPLVIHSGTTLDAAGATIQFKTNAISNHLIENKAVTASRTVLDWVTTASSTTATSATATFTSADNNATVWIYGAGADGQILKTTMTYVNATTATLANAASATLAAGRGSIGPRDSGINIRGGTWRRNATSSNSAATSGNNFHFRRGDAITILDVTVTTTTGKYAINFADCTDCLVERVAFNTYSDGVHINGPARNLTVRHLRGYCRDDVVSLTPDDWVGATDIFGDITDILIEDIKAATTNTVVKILGGSSAHGTTARRITARDIGGYATCAAQGFGGLVTVGDDTGQSTTVGGTVDEVVLENLHGVTPVGFPIVNVAGLNIGKIRISGIEYDGVGKTVPAVSLGGGVGSVVSQVLIEKVHARNVGGSGLVQTSSQVTTASLTVSDIVVANWNSTSSSGLIINTGPVGVLWVDRVTLLAATGGAIVIANAAITEASIHGVNITNNSNNAYVMLVQGVTVTAASISDVVGASGSYVVMLNNAVSVLSHLRLSNVNWKTGGGLVSTSVTGSSLPILHINNCFATSCSWGIGDIGGTMTVFADNLTATPSANIANLRAAAVVTVYASNVSFNGKTFQGTTGYSVSSKALGLRIDVSALNSKNSGDMAFNTNAALSCGVGPVVCDGSTWKNLFTGSTY